MRKVRCLYFLMSLFSLISLICIGFSSWTISGTGAEVMGTGGITASPVEDVDDYATCTNVTCFEFYSEGFLADGKLCARPQVTISYNLKFDNVTTANLELDIYFRGVDINGNFVSFENAGGAISKIHFVPNMAYSTFTFTKAGTSVDINAEKSFEIIGNYFVMHLTVPVPQDKEALTFSIKYEFDYSGTYADVYKYLISTDDNDNVLYDDEGNPQKLAKFYSHARLR